MKVCAAALSINSQHQVFLFVLSISRAQKNYICCWQLTLESTLNDHPFNNRYINPYIAFPILHIHQRSGNSTIPNQDLAHPQINMSAVRKPKNPVLAEKIAQMALPLAPLVRLTTGEIHPQFPGTLLNFWLLTSEQLDELAHFYHQRTPSIWSAHYPCPVTWGRGLTLEEKRRKIGRFIGLGGCESPIKSEEMIMEEMIRRARKERAEEELFGRKTRWY